VVDQVKETVYEQKLNDLLLPTVFNHLLTVEKCVSFLRVTFYMCQLAATCCVDRELDLSVCMVMSHHAPSFPYKGLRRLWLISNQI